MNISIACGGSGGHLFPGMAVGEELLRRGHKVQLIISEKPIDVQSARLPGAEIQTLPATGLSGKNPKELVIFASNYLQSKSKCKRIFREFETHLVLGMGGFVAAPALAVANAYSVPTVIHESNVIPGKANVIASQKAARVIVGFPQGAAHFPSHKTVCLGTPVRSSLKKLDAIQARKSLALHPDKFTVLVLGGSQGAAALNKSIIDSLPHLDPEEVQFIHSAGKELLSELEREYFSKGFQAFVRSFIAEIEVAYSAASMAISRAGASSLNELAWYGLPSVLVPYPFAAEDHQKANAQVFTHAGAADMMEQKVITPFTLSSLIREYKHDPEKLSRMSLASTNLSKPNAAAEIADVVVRAAMEKKMS